MLLTGGRMVRANAASSAMRVMSRIHRRLSFAVIAVFGTLAAMMALGASPALATTDVYLYASPNGITGSPASGLCSSTACSLQTALNQAASSFFNSSDAVTIILDTGTYTGSFSIASGSEYSLSLSGNGPAVTTINGDGSQTISITGPLSFSVTIGLVTIENGQAEYGDNVYAGGGNDVSLTQDVVSGGGESSFGGSVAVDSGTYLAVNNTTIEGDIGSGLDVVGSSEVDVYDSTFSGNAGGGIVIGSGFGSSGSGGSVTVQSSTITGNGSDNSDYAGILDYGVHPSSFPVDVYSSTITDNGAAGVATNGSTSSIDISGDILADNAAGSVSEDCHAYSGTIVDEGYNYSDDTTCPNGSGTSHRGETDAELGLGSLAYNGFGTQYGVTETQGITTASVAYDAVPDSVSSPIDFCSATDERGEPYLPTGATACDAGAFQVTTPVTYYASPGGGGSCSSPSPGCTLAAALTDAEASGDTGYAVTIDLAAGIYPTSSTIVIGFNGVDFVGSEFSLTLDGAATDTTFINGAGTTSGTFELYDGPYIFTIENLTIENGGNTSFGTNFHAVDSSGEVNLIDDTISGGTGSSSSSAVSSSDSTLNIDDSTVSDTDSFGLYATTDSTVSIDDSLLSGSPYGGAQVIGSSATITDSTITGGGESGGDGVFASGADVGVYGSTIADSAGGGVDSVSGSTVDLGGDIIAGESAGDCTTGAGTIVDEGYNFGDDGTCTFTNHGNASDASLDVGALAARGGPTDVLPITNASGAFDVIPTGTTLPGETAAFCSGNDQRGIARTQGTAALCDAGAYQAELPNVTSLSASSRDVGLTVTVNGSHLASVTSASFGSTPATISNQSDSSLTLAIPSTLATGSEEIALTNIDGTTDVAFSALADPTVSTSTLAAGQVGAAYSQTLAEAGGTGPYSFTLASGSLPAGLSLSSAGVIAGTPTAAGSATFAVKVSDGDGLASPSQTLSITIAAAPVPVVTVISASIKVKHGQAPLALSCQDAACSGTVTLSETVHTKVKHHTKTEHVTIASGDYSTGAGQTTSVTLSFSSKAHGLLAHIAKHARSEKLTVTVSGGATVSETISVT